MLPSRATWAYPRPPHPLSGVIDQDQARKFWTNWVRREIGGNDMIQEAAVSAALNELLLGHDNQAAADAARNTARQLGGGLSSVSATPSTATPVTTQPANPPIPAPGVVASKISAPLSPGKPMLARPWPYLAGAAGLVVAVILVIFAAQNAHTIGCLVGSTELGLRKTRLHNTYVRTFNRDTATIDACKSVDCERAPKLEIVAALKTYNDGLNGLCWPDRYKADAAALVQANSALADSVNLWADASTSDEDDSRAQVVSDRLDRRRAADAALSRDLGIRSATPAPSPS